MISDVKSAITSKLMGLYPTGYAIYDEEAPETAAKPYFLISVTNQTYSKRFNNKYSSVLYLDIAYHSDQAEVRADGISKQEALLRDFDYISTYKVRNKAAKITDNVLHFTFDLQYYELTKEEFTLMQQQTINTRVKI
ncbi:MAG TPA: hypothetical protein GXX75_03105 [Clostridiales bacterium]|nr:hypothetical protein [Clostridiales bacterium]